MPDLDVKYPDIEVQLTGLNGNAMVIMAEVASALRKAGVPSEEIKAFYDESMSGDYNNVITTAGRWVSIS